MSIQNIHVVRYRHLHRRDEEGENVGLSHDKGGTRRRLVTLQNRAATGEVKSTGTGRVHKHGTIAEMSHDRLLAIIDKDLNGGIVQEHKVSRLGRIE